VQPREFAGLLAPAVRAALGACGRASGQVSVLVAGDAELCALNRQFRDIYAPTDVLSFPSGEDAFAGDIAISAERARAQAAEYGHTFERELCYLAVHAVLHLLGYTHDDETGRRAMREKEEEIMTKIGQKR
jgi:probable rRNA maturation factor